MAKLPRGISRFRGRYRVRLNVDGVQHSLGVFDTLGDARAALSIARAEKARGMFVPPPERRRRLKAEREAREAQTIADTHTCRDLAEEWLSWQEERGLKQGTVYTYRRHLEAHFLNRYADTPLSHMTALELDGWLDRLEAETGPINAANVHRDVAAMFKYAAGDAVDLPRTFSPLLLTSPVPPVNARRFRRNPVTRNRVVMADRDVRRLSELMAHPEDRLIILLSGYAALRLGEVLALRRRHLKADQDGTYWLTVEGQVQARGSGVRLETPKTAAGRRTIPVPAVIAADVATHLRKHVDQGADALVFPRHPGGADFHNPNTIGGRFRKALELLNAEKTAAAKKAGRTPALVEDFTFHGLRHTALTRLGQAGATTAELKAYAGHSDSKSVEVYQHAEKRRLASLSAVVGREGIGPENGPENAA